jgi:predicted esterase
VEQDVKFDSQRIALSGFSDGASYALGLGLANGDLFDSVLGLLDVSTTAYRPERDIFNGCRAPAKPPRK